MLYALERSFSSSSIFVLLRTSLALSSSMWKPSFLPITRTVVVLPIPGDPDKRQAFALSFGGSFFLKSIGFLLPRITTSSQSWSQLSKFQTIVLLPMMSFRDVGAYLSTHRRAGCIGCILVFVDFDRASPFVAKSLGLFIGRTLLSPRSVSRSLMSSILLIPSSPF